jgi:formate dehydrogenase major subunit
MSEIFLTINGKKVAGKTGDTILGIALENGIEIPNLCHADSLKHYGACGLCVVEAEGVPKLLRSCSTEAKDGMVVNSESARAVQSRKIALELLMSDHKGDCVGPCSLNCPAGTNCQGYAKAIALGNEYEAVKIIKEKLPLPASIGRVCPHPCETACRRQYVEEPLSIAFLKSYAADTLLKNKKHYLPEIPEPTGKTVGIVGGGPAGLTAAYFLKTFGHDVTIYEALPKMGGMLRYGIPEYRLPKKVLDAEIAEIVSLGVRMKNDVKIGETITFEDIKKSHDAVLVAIGAWTSMKIGCKGEELTGVVGGIDFLREVALGSKPAIGGSVAVVGGGNTAMDACRSAIRLGAKNVYVIYRRTQAEMPAEEIEYKEACEEGVTFKFLTNPEEIIGEGGKVSKIKLQVMRLGEPDASGRRSPVPVEGKFEYLDVDTVIAAIGQKVDPAGFDVELNKKGIIAADEATFRTSDEKVFAVGDATNKGAGIAIAAIGEANKAAYVIDGFLKGRTVGYKKPYVSETKATEEDFKDKERIPRAVMPHRSPAERRKDFEEINLGLTKEQAMKEAQRCLECGCHDYGDCKLIKYANLYKLHPERLAGSNHAGFVEENLVVIERNQNKCILCGLCVRVCEEVAKEGILGLVGRGFDTVIKPEFNDPKRIAVCATCRKCAQLCPTGALRIIKD